MFRAPDRRSPCPCCVKAHPKFCDGKIAWFPLEAVIRIIGPDCFKSLDAEGHQEAVDNLNAERRREKDTKFLISRIPYLGQAIAAGETAIRVGDALETFHRELHGKLQIGRLDLWRDVQRDGELRITFRTQEVRRNNKMEEYFVDTEAERVAYRLDGYEVLNPHLRIGTATLKSAIRKLNTYNTRTADSVDQMDDTERHKAAAEIGQAMTAVQTASKNLTRWQKFVTPLAINSLKNWGAHEGCRTPYTYELSGDRFAFGPSKYRSYSVQIPPDLSLSIRSFEL